MTFWKVDLLKPAEGIPEIHWFRNSRDAESFCDRIPGSIYETNYYCREVEIPRHVLEFVRQEVIRRAKEAEQLEKVSASGHVDARQDLKLAC